MTHRCRIDTFTYGKRRKTLSTNWYSAFTVLICTNAAPVYYKVKKSSKPTVGKEKRKSTGFPEKHSSNKITSIIALKLAAFCG